MASINLNGLLKDLFSPDLPALSNAHVLEIGGLGSSPRSVFVLSRDKIALDSAGQAAFVERHSANGWGTARINQTLARLLNPSRARVGFVDGKVRFVLGDMSGAGLRLSNAAPASSELYWPSVLAEMEMPFSTSTYFGNHLELTGLRRDCAAAVLGLPTGGVRRCSTSEFPVLSADSIASHGDYFNDPQKLVVEFTKLPLSDSYVMLLMSGARGLHVKDWIVFLKERTAADAGVAAYYSGGAYVHGLADVYGSTWLNSANDLNYWRAQPSVGVSNLAAALGLSDLGHDVYSSGMSPNPEGFDGRGFEGYGQFAAHTPLYAYGFNGSLSALVVDGDVTVKADQASGPFSYSHIKVTPSRVESWVNTQTMLTISQPGPDASAADIAKHDDDVVKLAASGIKFAAAISLPAPVDVASHIDSWGPYSTAIEVGLDPATLSLGEVTVAEVVAKARQLPAIQDFLVLLGAKGYAANVFCNAVKIVAVDQFEIYDFVAGAHVLTKTVSGEDEFKQFACLSPAYIATTFGDSWLAAKGGWSAYVSALSDVRTALLKSTKRLVEHAEQITPAMPAQTKAQYAADAVISDRLTTAKQIHSLTLWNLSHRLPVVSAGFDALVLNGVSHAIQARA